MLGATAAHKLLIKGVFGPLILAPFFQLAHGRRHNLHL